MVVLVAFQLIFWICALYAICRGGGPERIGAVAMIAATTSSLAAAHWGLQWNGVFLGVLLIDGVLLVVFYVLALHANRVWPMLATAAHMIQTSGHFVKIADLETPYFAYWATQLWSFPIVLLLAIGTWHHQVRRKRYGADPSWSGSFARSAATGLGTLRPS